jgi:hypothetical protein
MKTFFDKFSHIVLALFLFGGAVAFSQDISVETATDKREAVVGESITFQIIVRGTTEVEDPGSVEMDGFSVSYYGKRDLSNTSITIVNGKMSQVVDHTIVCQYTLVPQRTGNLTIPSVLVKVQGKSQMTDPIDVQVSKATETADYRLRVTLSKNSCYVGEKLAMTVTWYFSKKVGNPVFNVPVFDDGNFNVLESSSQAAGAQYVNVNLGSQQINARFNQANSGFSTVVIDRILIPRISGSFEIPAATVQFQGSSGKPRGYDFFGNEVYDYKQYVIPSNALTLNVLPVPQAGKPANYSGLIGSFSLDAVASPVDVQVGDPITLTLTLRGKGNIEDARLPALDRIPALTKDFKIPKEMSPGEAGDGAKTFTQTLRALRPDVASIPAIEIPYLNSQTGKYEYARSRVIPIRVAQATKNLTTSDIEGASDTGIAREVEVFASGIAHNYEGPDVLKNQTYGLVAFVTNPLYLLVLLFPVFGYIALFAATRMYHLSKVPQTSKKVSKVIDKMKRLCADSAPPANDASSRLSGLLDLFKEYLGLKLGQKGATITYRDIEDPLASRGVSEETLKSVKEIFTACEAASYAGGVYGFEAFGSLSLKVLSSVSDIERSIR